MVATEASGVWPVMACQRRQSQLTTVVAIGHSRNMWLMVKGWVGVQQQAKGQHACCGVALPLSQLRGVASVPQHIHGVIVGSPV